MPTSNNEKSKLKSKFLNFDLSSNQLIFIPLIKYVVVIVQYNKIILLVLQLPLSIIPKNGRD